MSWFDTELRNRGLSFGILIAINGITGDPAALTAAYSTIARALAEQRQILIFNGAELSALRTTEELVHAIKEKLCDLAVMGSVMTNGVRSSAVRGAISTSRCRLSGTTWPGIKSELFRLAYAQFSRSGTAKPARKRR
jgi:hypothetical protein